MTDEFSESVRRIATRVVRICEVPSRFFAGRMRIFATHRSLEQNNYIAFNTQEHVLINTINYSD